ncbi:L,D-transpeptidase family protein [Roseomonas sp. BN140053]|uniref:L,D-transpeptidase family protein n=1 Tax=Roseomonas sp. BN140053 TaxID=3391898 RepID=UPI0039E8BAF3
MIPTRRSLAVALLGASSLATAVGLRPRMALGQVTPATGSLDVRARLLQAQLVTPVAARQVRIGLDRTLERLNDLAIDFSAPRLIVVNIASAEVIAYEDGREVLRSRVVVGAGRTRTPQLATFVTSVRCNPPWYVPASIEPEIRAAGAVGFRTINGHLVQPPGPRNPLGPIRIGLQDSDGIFLHGTSNPELFARSGRALSHGCVRVERIFELAAWLLDTMPPVLRATVATGRTTDTVPPTEVQVVLAYLTVWPAADGRLVHHSDPYGLDQPGSRRAAYRRIMRPPTQTPADAEAAAAAATPQDDPL